jgi:hypothetical protein
VDGAIQGAAAVHEAVVAAREIYEFQDFHYAGPVTSSSPDTVAGYILDTVNRIVSPTV